MGSDAFSNGFVWDQGEAGRKEATADTVGTRLLAAVRLAGESVVIQLESVCQVWELEVDFCCSL